MTAQDGKSRTWETPLSVLHTGDDSCRLRPLHDPCHTGCSEDGRSDPGEIARDLLAGWRSYLSRQAAPGPDRLYATGRAGSLPEMRAAAMAKARTLYGEDAELRVEGAGPVRGYGGEFICEFTIRCLNFPGEAL